MFVPAGHPQIDKARALRPMVGAASPENDDIRKLTAPVVSALLDGGFFHMLKPKSVGGMELKPIHFTQVTEALASSGTIPRSMSRAKTHSARL